MDRYVAKLAAKAEALEEAGAYEEVAEVRRAAGQLELLRQCL